MSSEERPTSKIGSINLAALDITSELTFDNVGFVQSLQQLAQSAAKRITDDKEARERYRSLPSFLNAHYKHCCFFAYAFKQHMDIWDAEFLQDDAEFGCKAALIGNHFADAFVGVLFNYWKTLCSPEFITLGDITPEQINTVFRKEFPNLRHARDAVAHRHDRQLGRKRDTNFAEARPRFGGVYCYGKYYHDDKGDEFEFAILVESVARLASRISDEMNAR